MATPTTTSPAPGDLAFDTVDRDGWPLHDAEVAWVVGVPWQGHGYASEAAAALVDWLAQTGVATVIAFVHPGHAASSAVARRIGLGPTEELVDGELVWRRDVGSEP